VQLKNQWVINMKWLALLLVLNIIIIARNDAHGAEVQAYGHGANYDEALQSAKTSAIEQAASTFVTGKRELNNGTFSENLAQYNGAVINRVHVTSVNIVNGLYEVQINADVQTDKVNSFALDSSQAISSDTIIKMLNASSSMQDVQNAFTGISTISYPFVVTSFSPNEYKIAHSIEITHYSRAQWNTKYIDDVIKLIKVINQPLSKDTRAVICIDDECSSVPVLPKLSKTVGYQIIEQHVDGKDIPVKNAMLRVQDSYKRNTNNLWEYTEDTHIIWGTFSIGLTPNVPTLHIYTDRVEEHYVTTNIAPNQLKNISGFTHVLDLETKYK